MSSYNDAVPDDVIQERAPTKVHTWTEGAREFLLEEDGTLIEEGEPGNSAPQQGSIPSFVARRVFNLAHELQVERAHREAAERQRDDKTEEIRCLREEREGLYSSSTGDFQLGCK